MRKETLQGSGFLAGAIPVFERVQPVDIVLDAGHGGKDQGADKALAEALQKSVIAQTNARDRETKSADYVVLTTTKMPSALVEVGFLSDAEERALLGQEEYQEKLAKGIAEAILDYLAE